VQRDNRANQGYQHPDEEVLDPEPQPITGEAAAAQERRKEGKGRNWPLIGACLGLPVLGLGVISILAGGSGTTPSAANIVAVPVQPLQQVSQEAAAAAQEPQRSTVGPGGASGAVIERSAGTLASTSRSERARGEAAKAREAAQARADAAQARTAPPAAQTPPVTPASAEREDRPGVNTGRPWVNRHPEMTIPSHTPITCMPDGPINSDGLGPVSCTVTQPVRSEDGTNFLLWPGAVLEGNLVQGLQAGQRRLFLGFERIRTTDYVRIPLRGIGASALGENGVTGTYDDRMWEKVKAGIFLTVVEGAVDAVVGAASAAAQGAGNTYLNFGGASGRARGALGQSAIQQDYNRPGTLRRDHADTITVKTIGDIDLSPVYELREVRAAVAATGLPPVVMRNR
jgi:type IV secretory pathway VirB10-like protein